MEKKSNGKAVASLVLGIASLVFAFMGWGAILSLVLAVVGCILGVQARKELSAEEGRGLATAGMVCSIIGIVLGAIGFVTCVLCAGLLTSIGSNLGAFDYGSFVS